VGAVTSLFELRTPAHLYEDLGGAIFFALVPLVVAGGVPVLAAEATERAPLRAVRLAGRYLYAVVLLVYLAILFAYTIKVAVTGDLPKNLLSPIVLFAGLAGLLGGMLLEPLQDDAESRGVARLVRFFPALLLPLLPLPIWAVGMRQDQYGWTEFRYLRLLVLCAMAVLAVWGTVRLVRRRPPLLSPIPAVLAAALLLGVVGPWSAQAVSRRDQSARLRAALAEAGMTRGGRLVRPLLPQGKTSPRPTTLPAAQYAGIAGALSYLYDAHGAEVASRALGANVGVYDSGWQAVAALAINEGCRRDVTTETYYGSLPIGTPIATAGGTVFLVSTDRWVRGGNRAPGTAELEPHATAVTFHRGGAASWSARAELAPLTRLLTANGADCLGPITNVQLAPENARIPLLDARGRSRGELVVTSMTYGSPGASSKGAMKLERVEGMVIARE
jgi:hypothetical protein